MCDRSHDKVLGGGKVAAVGVTDAAVRRDNPVEFGSQAMTYTQLRTFDGLLAVGAPRPYAEPGIVDEVRAAVADGCAGPLARWTESSLWLSKGQIFSALRCERQFLADRSRRAAGSAAGKSKAAAIGDVTHRCLQLAHTHPGRLPADYARQALSSLLDDDPEFAEFYRQSDMACQSDILTASVSRVTGFLDSWPPLADSWVPRFEESMQAKIGPLTLAARVDLVLGRPRGNGQQTMLLSDWKTGALHDDHAGEAGFYALVSTLRHGVPPFRSTVFSLASGEFTAPDVTSATLRAAAATVVDAVTVIVDLLTERRPPRLDPADECWFCRTNPACDLNGALRDQ